VLVTLFLLRHARAQGTVNPASACAGGSRELTAIISQFYCIEMARFVIVYVFTNRAFAKKYYLNRFFRL
jgi:hypothetical protein